MPGSISRWTARENGCGVFTSADGFYYLGEALTAIRFAHGRRPEKGVSDPASLRGAGPYSNTPGRVISVSPGCRTRNVGRLYTGMMGLPRELGSAGKRSG